ncbi:hypothetical protein [Nostoc sp. FACHB-110]|uniref:hypothetical protein n=1 Tax=Nostoc sp. FACHB-110 TaxID=2692834 RepID=UPI00168898B4|nr:hypothetical protein [Nostoc sp. FACHB-110]MBD2441294.1 hypothetical protein [Nostoc sp. FACHB-110]
MATKKYLAKYRKLRQIYERAIDKTISDETWYRVVSFLKQRFSLRVESENAETIVETFAGLKRRYSALSPTREGFEERWRAFKYFYDSQGCYSGIEALSALANYLKINLDDVPQSTRYYWFSQAGLSYSIHGSYHSKDLALVAFVAAKWAINKRSQPMKSADPKVLTLAK